jgi:hypothetical protein
MSRIPPNPDQRPCSGILRRYFLLSPLSPGLYCYRFNIFPHEKKYIGNRIPENNELKNDYINN